jgi:hypothetical protein
LRFSLDRKFADVDTANPDSGDVEAPGGPGRGTKKVRNDTTKPARVLNKKIEREVHAPRPHLRREFAVRLRETTGRGRALAFRAGIESDRLAVYFFRLRPIDIWI